jgi:hypothetical protein
MDQKIENFMSMSGSVDDTLTDEVAIVGAVPALATGHLNLKSKIALVKGYQLIQGTQLSGWATKKGTLKEDMADKSMKIVNGVTAYALAKEDSVLFEEMNYSKSKLSTMRDEEADVTCDLINTKASAIPILDLKNYGLLAADLTNQTDAIGLYKAVKQMPSGKVDERQVAKKGVEDTVALMRKDFDLMDRVVKTLNDTQPEFVTRYFNAREIYDLGVRHDPPTA